MIFFGFLTRMGRDVTGLRIDKKSIMVNDKSNGSPNRAVHVAPKALPENSETNEEQDAVLGVESTNNEPEEKIIKPEMKKSTDKQISLPAKPESGSASNGTAEKQASCSSHANGVDDDDSSERVLSKSHYLDSPKSTKKSQFAPGEMATKHLGVRLDETESKAGAIQSEIAKLRESLQASIDSTHAQNDRIDATMKRFEEMMQSRSVLTKSCVFDASSSGGNFNGNFDRNVRDSGSGNPVSYLDLDSSTNRKDFYGSSGNGSRSSTQAEIEREIAVERERRLNKVHNSDIISSQFESTVYDFLSESKYPNRISERISSLSDKFNKSASSVTGEQEIQKKNEQLINSGNFEKSRSCSNGTIEEQLLEIKQSKSVEEYRNRLISFAASLGGDSEEIKLSEFVNGFETVVRVEMRLRWPTCLEEAIQFAVRIEERNRDLMRLRLGRNWAYQKAQSVAQIVVVESSSQGPRIFKIKPMIEKFTVSSVNQVEENEEAELVLALDSCKKSAPASSIRTEGGGVREIPYKEKSGRGSIKNRTILESWLIERSSGNRAAVDLNEGAVDLDSFISDILSNTWKASDNESITVDSDNWDYNAKNKGPNAHFMSRKQLQPNHKNYYDEEDNWSLASSKKKKKACSAYALSPRGLRLAFWQANANAYAFAFSDIVIFSFLFFSVAFLINLVVCYALAFGIFLSICSTATSVRNKITVPVAPRFSCVDRLDRRKEFYTKLEEKHKALEKEKLDYEARTKEEEQAAIKQLRKSMVVKAKPVPSFYREGPPPKVELKKLPVTRAKSPNLTRRKSCGDAAAVKPSPEDKGLCGRASRHSVGIHKEGKASPVQKKPSPLTPKSNMRKLNGSKKVNNQSKDTTDSSHGNEHGSADISVES
ncbi:hypothetical protein OROGR_020361 [Orobanche gracilis]